MFYPKRRDNKSLLAQFSWHENRTVLHNIIMTKMRYLYIGLIYHAFIFIICK